MPWALFYSDPTSLRPPGKQSTSAEPCLIAEGGLNLDLSVFVMSLLQGSLQGSLQDERIRPTRDILHETRAYL